MTKIRIFKNFLQPHKIPKKIFQKLKYIYKFKTYQKELFKKKQEFFFEELGLDRKKGVENLNLTKEKFEILPNGMSSEHEVLFSSISLAFSYLNLISFPKISFFKNIFIRLIFL